MVKSAADPWIFNYRAEEEGSGDEGSDVDQGCHRSSGESMLWSELDISRRKDTAVFKPNPFTIAKINAITRACTATASQKSVTEISVAKPALAGKSGTIESFFKKRQGISSTAAKDSLKLRNPASIQKPKQPTGVAPQNPVQELHRPPNAEVYMPRQSTPRLSSSARQLTTISESIPINPVHTHSPFAPDSARVQMKQVKLPQRSTPALRDPFVASMSKPRSRVKEEAIDNSPLKAESPSPLKLSNERGPSRTPQYPTAAPLPSLVSRNLTSAPDIENKVKVISTPAGPAYLSHPQERKPFRSVLPRNKPIVSVAPTTRALPCYNIGKDDDESWSTLPPPKKKFKPSVDPFLKNKIGGPFRIPGLGGGAAVQKSGMSATAPVRVITFLPTPLVPPVDRQVQGHSKRFDAPNQQSSPPSSPASFALAEEVDWIPDRASSPPTSDLPYEEDELEVSWNGEFAKDRYSYIPQRVAEV